MRLREGERVHEMSVHVSGEGVEVVVDGRRRRVKVVETAPGRFVLHDGPRCERFHCVRDGGVIHLFWRGQVHTLTEEREGVRSAHRAEAGRLESPMPGRVTAVRVAPGQAVAKGEELLVVESMKMENALRAPRDGRVKSVYARPGEMVGPGLVLVELE